MMYRLIILCLLPFVVNSACDASTPPTNGAVGNCDNALANSSSCVPACDTGYTIAGTTTCGTDVLTSSATCTADACTATEVANSDLSATGAITGNTGDAVTVTCATNYWGSGDAVCGTDATFSTITCSNICTPTQVANSDLSANGSITGTIGGTPVTVTCDTGYSGSGDATCQSDGSFSVITCAAIPCTATEVANSDKSATGAITGSTGDVVAVVCDDGYSGSGDATCGNDTNFSTVTCTVNACTATEVANSDLSATGAITGNTGDAVTVTCVTNYWGSGDAVCGTDGNFSTITCSNTCTPTQVANSDKSTNGDITGTIGGSDVTVTCDTGYTGSGDATCQSDGSFTVITCTGIPCTATEVANSDKSTTGDITGSTGDVVAVVCDTGYSGSGDATCGNDTVFSTVTCTANACTATEVANSDKATTGDITGNTGDVVAVVCDTGYTGSGDATCGTDGNFSTVTCTGIACTATEVANSDKAATGSITGGTGDVVAVVCDTGYTGSGNATCGDDTNFSTVTCTATTTVAPTTATPITTTASVNALLSGLWIVVYAFRN